MAGISATLFVLVLNQKPSVFSENDLILVSTLLVFAISLFAVASETFTDALEFSNPGTNVNAILTHDTAIALLLLALSIIVWVEGYALGAVVPVAFSSYFSKDAIWLIRRKNREAYRDYLIKERLEHVRDNFKHTIPTALACLSSAMFGIVYLYRIPTGQHTIVGLIVAFAVGHLVSAAIYLRWSDFLSDAQVTTIMGMLIMVLALFIAPTTILYPPVVLSLIGAILVVSSPFRTRVRRTL